MEVQKDFKELLSLFNSHGVEYVIVGAFAVAQHGAPRFTGDLDIHVHADSANAVRVLDALTTFGFGGVGLTAEDFASPGKVIQLGYPPVRIDLLTSISGVSWEEASGECVPGTFGDVAVRYLGLKQLAINKRSVGRLKDLADLEALGELS